MRVLDVKVQHDHGKLQQRLSCASARGVTFEVVTWLNGCCGLNSLECINTDSLNKHYKEIFHELKSLNEKQQEWCHVNGKRPPYTPDWGRKIFQYTNSKNYVQTWLPDFVKSPNVTLMGEFINHAHGEHLIQMFLIDISKDIR